MQRILVSGISGAGKSRLARAVAARLDLPYVELDALHHGPNWTKRPSFEADVEAFSAGERWITEEQYHGFLGDRLWSRADTLVWLDYGRPLVMSRVLRRTIARAALRRTLWNGNREPVIRWVRDPEHPVRWAWSQHAARRRRTAARIEAHPHLRVYRFSHPRHARRWLAGLG